MQDVDQLRNQEQKVFPLKHSAASERGGEWTELTRGLQSAQTTPCACLTQKMLT